jgi:cysteate synthase
LKYTLKCSNCGSSFRGSGFDFSCPHRCDSLVKTVYHKEKITFQDHPGIWRYVDWLPVEKTTNYEGRSITYKSSGLADELRLKNLYISFNGFWPERSGLIKTCTFKEFEAVVTLQYARENGIGGFVIASAGNVANAFGYMASLEKFKVVLVVPEKALPNLRVPYVDEEYVKVIGVKGEFSDAISIAKKLHATGIPFDGGGKSVARRDALSTPMLAAVEHTGRIPKHYFQSISSGTGAVATFEVAERLQRDGRFGKIFPKIHVSQNKPFAPAVKAWKERRRKLQEQDFEVKNPFDHIYAKVLSNREPIYGIKGGIFDALSATQGEAYEITNEEAIEAAKLFEDLEGIDIVPAAAVAAASLMKAVDQRKIDPRDEILLNITGGGSKRVEEDVGLETMKSNMRADGNTLLEELRELVDEHFSGHY